MTTARCARCSHASSGQSVRVLLAVFGLLALLGVSCSVRKTSQTSVSSSDSLTERIEVRQHPVTLPAETTSLKLPMPTLQTLPEGAGYYVRKGRLTLTATRRGDSLELAATTDSTQVLLTEETRRSLRHKTLRQERHEHKDVRAGLTAALTRPLTLIIIALLITTAIALWHKIKSKRR